MPFNSESGRKAGKSSKRGTSRINDELKSKLRSIINESIETINISCLSNREKIDIIKTVLPFILSKRKSEDPEVDESNREFVIEILNSENKADK